MDTHYRGHEVIVYYPPLVFCRSEESDYMLVYCNRSLPYADDNGKGFWLVRGGDKWGVYDYIPNHKPFNEDLKETGDMATCINWLLNYYRQSFVENCYFRANEPPFYYSRRHHFFETDLYRADFHQHIQGVLWDLHLEERMTGRHIFQKRDFEGYYAALDYFTGWLWDTGGEFITHFMMENYIDYLTAEVMSNSDFINFDTLWGDKNLSYFAARENPYWQLEYANPRQPGRVSPVLYKSKYDVAQRIAREIAWQGRAEEFYFISLWEYLKNDQRMSDMRG